MHSMMKKWLLAGFLSLLGAGCGGGVSTREEALDIVLDDVVDPAGYPAIEIFATPEPLPVGTEVGIAFDSDAEGPKTLATLTEPTWLLFVDLQPQSRFEHPVKLVLITRADGRHQTFDAKWWPKVNG